MNDDTKPLKSIDYKKVIEGLTQTETQQAAELLNLFLRDLSSAGIERVAVLAYLIGVKQGRYELVEHAKGKLMELHKSGVKSALHQLAVLVRMHPGIPATTHIDNLLAACNDSESKDSPSTD